MAVIPMRMPIVTIMHLIDSVVLAMNYVAEVGSLNEAIT